MKGTERQKQMLRDLGIQDWSDKELKEAPDGFTLEEYETTRLHRESESKSLPDAGKASP